jgi:hypothetical protein
VSAHSLAWAASWNSSCASRLPFRSSTRAARKLSESPASNNLWLHLIATCADGGANVGADGGADDAEERIKKKGSSMSSSFGRKRRMQKK